MGTELLATGSILAAFFAGGVALFAPCCIVFLAPSYLAGAVKNARWRLLPLTFVFAAGLAAVLVPITLGVSALAGAIARYHAPLYWAGGVLMLALAALALSGRMWSLPSFVRAPDTARGDTASFFALGIFSGIASSCCAPVLAGVMTLSALSGSLAGGFALGLAYVFGMVFPLFVMALLWDRARLGERRLMRARLVRLHAGRFSLVTNTINVAVAIAFAIMGLLVIALAASEDMTGGTSAQDAASRVLTRTFGAVQSWLAPVPEVVLGIGLLALAGAFVWGALVGRRARTSSAGVEPLESEPSTAHDADIVPHEPTCHESATATTEGTTR
ncbi:cytochrome c biogenesis CcdA family protein [Cellulomonas algicola]|uniref:cytochrome c biogenesis CcdA family protein n=1 Tax=Cellulomonas algicola TaxID=2071633 RepID=UPI001C3FBC34|nr:cytochrome c biogenesis CcdA family protein [Cellulomonas algicola]